jgi:hypothetical protein
MLTDRFSHLTNFFSLVALVHLGAFLLLGASAEAATRADVQQWVVEEAVLTKVPPSLALAVAKVESNFRDDALGTQGERGVMQIMPSTARGEFGVPAGRLWDGRLNINLGLRYLERLYDQYGGRWHLALSHYNGGTLKGRGANAVPHPYTRKYVANVLALKNAFERRNIVAQLKQSVEVTDANLPSGNSSVDYWMLDDPEMEKDWRHYVDVANFWLKSEEERGKIFTQTHDQTYRLPSDTESFQHSGTASDWSIGGSAQPRPSDRWKKGAARLRRSFRHHVRGEGSRWDPVSNLYGKRSGYNSDEGVDSRLHRGS